MTIEKLSLTSDDALRARRWVSAAIAATLAGFALGLGYVVDEGIFGPLSDLAAIGFAVTLLPVAIYLHRVFQGRMPRGSQLVVALALVGLPLLALAAAGLIVRELLDIDTTVPILGYQHLGIFLQGLWMVGLGVMGLRVGPFRRRVSLGALIGGFGYAAGAPVSYWIGFESPLFYSAFLVALAGFLTWALSLRTDLADMGRASGMAVDGGGQHDGGAVEKGVGL